MYVHVCTHKFVMNLSQCFDWDTTNTDNIIYTGDTKIILKSLAVPDSLCNSSLAPPSLDSQVTGVANYDL